MTYLVWAILHFPRPIASAQILAFCMLIGFGLITLYSFRFMFATLSVVLRDAGNIQFVWFQLWRLGTRPDPILSLLLAHVRVDGFSRGIFRQCAGPCLGRRS